MSLTSLIVQREIATIREVEEALARQVLYGGDLVTNLLEVSRIDEAALVPVVAESFGLPSAPPGPLPAPSAEAKQMVAAEVAVERNIAPLAYDKYGLVVAVAEPLSKDVEQELAFALAVPIAQKVAPLVRIKEALARDYSIAIERRMERLLKRLRGDVGAMGSIPPPTVAPQVNPPPRPPSAAPPPMRVASEPPRRSGMPDTLVRKTEVPPPKQMKRRRGPLTADVARVELEDVDQRDTIFDLVFEFARQYFDYTALFVVHGDVAEGRDASGDGASREKVARLGVPLDLPGLLADARIKKTILKRKLAEDGIDPVLAADLGRAGRTECVVFPIVVRTRVVALVLGDGGDAGVDDTSVDSVQAIVISAVAAFERLIVRRKLKGTAPPPGKLLSARPIFVATEAPKTELGDRPSIEELAPPIRDLMAEPVSRVHPETRREPSPEIVMKPSSSDRPMDLRPLSERPPPPNILGVRRPSGPPIPREEPDGLVASKQGPSRTKSGSLRRAEAPSFEFAPRPTPSSMTFGQNDVERSLLAQIQGTSERAPATAISPVNDAPPMTDDAEPPPSPKAISPPPPPLRAGTSRTEVSPGALPMFPAVTDDTSAPAAPVAMEGLITADPDKTPIAPPVEFDPPRQPYLETKSKPYLYVQPEPDDDIVDVDESGVEVQQLPSSASMPVAPDTMRQPMPISEQQVSVRAHRPPSARTDASRVLPSVIVDVASEYVAFVDRVLGGADDDAEAELLRAGGYAMPAIMARFPGPTTVDEERLDSGVLPRVSECGPVLRLVASQRRTALPFVLALVEDEDDEKRLWATFLLSELVYADAVLPAAGRVFDANPRIRRVARAALRAIADLHGTAVVDRLESVAKDKKSDEVTRVQAIEALGEAREPLAVPILIGLLEDDAEPVATASRHALVTITRQDHGADMAKWREWWSKNESRHRIEWLIDALMHEQASVRAAAGEELKTITKEQFGYYEDLPRRERTAAQKRYQDWWQSTGRLRFNRAR